MKQQKKTDWTGEYCDCGDWTTNETGVCETCEFVSDVMKGISRTNVLPPDQLEDYEKKVIEAFKRKKQNDKWKN